MRMEVFSFRQEMGEEGFPNMSVAVSKWHRFQSLWFPFTIGPVHACTVVPMPGFTSLSPIY